MPPSLGAVNHPGFGIGPRPSPHPAELRERAVRMVAEVRPSYESEYSAITAGARKLGIGTAETLRNGSVRTRSMAGRGPGSAVMRRPSCVRRTAGAGGAYEVCDRWILV